MVRYLVALFEKNKCGYERAIKWRSRAFSEGSLLSREHCLRDDYQSLVIFTNWRSEDCFNKYVSLNQKELDVARKSIESLGGKVVPFAALKDVSMFSYIDRFTFDQYKEG